MKLNDRYIKATLAGIPYLLPYGQLIAAPAPATRLNDSGSLLWDGILEGDSREELLALLATVTRPQSASARHLRKMSTSIFIPCAVWEFFLRIHPKAGAMIRLLFSTASVLWSFPTAVPLSYTTASSPAFSCEEEDFDQEVLILTGKPASIPYGAVLIHTEELTICDSGSSYCFFFAAPWGHPRNACKKRRARAPSFTVCRIRMICTSKTCFTHFASLFSSWLSRRSFMCCTPPLFCTAGAPFSFPAVPEPGSPHTLPCGMICTRRPS